MRASATLRASARQAAAQLYRDRIVGPVRGVLPVALATLEAQAGTDHAALDSASLYGNEDGAPYWQVVAWNGEDDPPLHVMVDARSGAVLPDH